MVGKNAEKVRGKPKAVRCVTITITCEQDAGVECGVYFTGYWFRPCSSLSKYLVLSTHLQLQQAGIFDIDALKTMA